MQHLYNLDNIRRIHIEITANCNSACPQCERFIKYEYGPEQLQPGFQDLKQGDLSPVIRDIQGSIGHMPFETYKNCINTTTAYNLKCIEFNGTWGDAIMHPELDKFIEYTLDIKRQIMPHNEDNQLGVKLATNGAIRSPKWWENLARLMQEFDQLSVDYSNGRKKANDNRVVFAIDGLDNVTHQMYRRGCELDRVLENAQAFIDAGGTAEWQWIEFKHNEHQIDDAVKLADKMGFKNIFSRGNRAIKEHFIRPDATKPRVIKSVDKTFDSTVDKKSNKSLDKKLDKVKEVKNKTLEYSTKAQQAGEAVRQKSLKTLENKYQGDIQEFQNKESIKCEWGNKGMINVEFNGMVHPCCHMNVYMNRLWRHQGISDDYHKMQELYDKDWNNLNKHTLQDILEHSYYKNDLEESWDNDKFTRLQQCKDNCIQEIDEQVFPIRNVLNKKN